MTTLLYNLSVRSDPSDFAPLLYKLFVYLLLPPVVTTHRVHIALDFLEESFASRILLHGGHPSQELPRDDITEEIKCKDTLYIETMLAGSIQYIFVLIQGLLPFQKVLFCYSFQKLFL